MQFKLTFVAAALATLVAATPAPRGEPASSCSTGPVQCCQSTQTVAQAASDPSTVGLLELELGMLITALTGDLAGLVGLTCSAVDIAGGGTCPAQTVCCTVNSLSGLISVGCIPVT
ncbi:fungal hydrophobin-domain-containing protein [Rhodocollybia butyracea]|uniref:Hydrophobin n=1 Tax=Rhodocollybia butyracea TaxID=206335 RepID=A0A9P5QA69_9AGAR|nr:fungal hydrophobin-domain-containing protein [Rhodocollybia butyracea]